MPDVIQALIRRPAARCFDAFCVMKRLPDWVPGLRQARIVTVGDDGLAREVLFEFGNKLSYSLLYRYDVPARRIEWAPGIGRRDAVTGWAEFKERGDGCEMSYALEPSGDGEESERRAQVGPLVDAFVRWIESEPA